MNYILCDPPDIERFYPFALTRPLGEMRVFGGTLKELWEKYLGCSVSYFTREYLSELYPTKFESKNILLNPLSILDGINYPEINFEYDSISSIDNLKYLIRDSFLGDENMISVFKLALNHINPMSSLSSINIGSFKNAFLNDNDGPIIIEDDVLIMDGAMIRGPVHICKGSVIKMGAKIYGPVVIGPYCKIGGEVSNSIFLGYSNKAHEGFLGHSLIGEWCNIGAGTSNSNLKNDYSLIKMWNYSTKSFQNSGEQFLGLYMGDHSKCAINTSFNTGTIVGVNCNIFGSGFPRNFLPSFSWGGSQGIKLYDFDKALFVAEKVMSRRGVALTKEYALMLKFVHDITSKMK